MRRPSLKIPTRHCHPDAAHSVNFPTASTPSTAFLRYSNLDGSHLWHCSDESKSASQVAVSTVAKHFLQMEFVVPSGLDRRTKSGGEDAIVNLRGTRGARFCVVRYRNPCTYREGMSTGFPLENMNSEAALTSTAFAVVGEPPSRSSCLWCDECPAVNPKLRYLQALYSAPFCPRPRGGHVPFLRKRGPTRYALPAPSASREWT